MKRKFRKSFQQLIDQNRLKIKNDPYEMERIEKKIDEKHSRAYVSR